MMKLATTLLIGGVSAARPNFATGQALGNALSEGISGDSQGFQQEMNAVFGAMPVVRNAAVEGVFASANAKYSFLQRRPTLNLHVGETKSVSLDEDAAALRASLAVIEGSEAALLAKLAHTSFIRKSPVSDVQRLSADAAAAKDLYTYYGNEIGLGGDAATRGLAGALNMVAEPNMRIPLVGLIGRAATLAKKESTPDSVRNLAGSLVTSLTNMPVSFQSQDVSGGYAHTNIILPSPSRVYGPDETIAELQAGAHVNDLYH